MRTEGSDTLGSDPRDTAASVRVDWAQVDRTIERGASGATGDGADDAPTDDPGEDQGDLGRRPGPRDLPLLDDRNAELLDPTRVRVPLGDLHASRLTPALGPEQAGIEQAWAEDHRPQSWIDRVNPAFADDARRGAAHHTTNCAECARAVQRTWEGEPTAAAAISEAGLPLEGGPEGGEHPAYTEQWAGQHAERVTYAEIDTRVQETRGSAIVFAHGDGGHAFNALWDADRHVVIWADGQTGDVGDWPPTHLVDRMPNTSAIFFPPTRRPT